MNPTAEITNIESQNDGSDDNKMRPELWELVASKMTSKEWARARCVSPAMYKVKLKNIWARPINSGELARMARDVSSAKTLWLDLTSASCSVGIFSKIWHKKVPTLEHLQQLSLSLSLARQSPFQMPEPPKRNESICPWLAVLADVVASASNLEVLRLNVTDAPALPPMDKLRHLNLITCKPLSEETCGWLKSLSSLQTLSLEQSPDAKLKSASEAPPLDLSASKHLQSVTLFHVLPRDFQVPPKCAVTVWADHHSLEPAWANLYSRTCRGCSVLVPNSAQAFPNFFADMFVAPAAHLTALRIELPHDQLGSMSRPLLLGDNLPALKSFRGRARDIFLKLGGRLRLESLRCDAQFSVHIEVADEDVHGIMSELKDAELFWAGSSKHANKLRSQLDAFHKAGRRFRVALEQQRGSFYRSFQARYHAVGSRPRDEEKLCLGCGACGMCLQQKRGIAGLFGPP